MNIHFVNLTILYFNPSVLIYQDLATGIVHSYVGIMTFSSMLLLVLYVCGLSCTQSAIKYAKAHQSQLGSGIRNWVFVRPYDPGERRWGERVPK